VEQKQRLQQMLFPHGVQLVDAAYRTTETSLIFYGLEAEVLRKKDLVAVPGIEPGFPD
jgi:hypothetical protein